MSDALVLIDKPSGWTSHDVVARVRRLSGTRRVGHAGTLDPMATGLLVVGVDRATRLLRYLAGHDKSYLATFRLGASTVTDDREGLVVAAASAAAVRSLTDADVAREVGRLTGELRQVPSAVSAVKVAGRRSYARVRAGEDVALEPRTVRVHRFDVLTVSRAEVSLTAGAGPSWVVDVDAEVHCSAGTYVRALARDLGAALGVGGHLVALRRTRCGPFAVSEAQPLPGAGGRLGALPVAEAVRRVFACRELDDEEVRLVAHGQRLASAGLGPEPVAAFAPDGTLVALLRECGPLATPVLVMAPA